MLQFLPDTPIVPFTILLAVILTVPPIFERLRLPGLVGLLVAGVILGPSGIQLLTSDDQAMKLFTEIGKIYLMFVAGLEIDLAEFRKTKERSLGFGMATFALPLIGGLLLGKIFGFGWNSSVLIGSLLASHTLLGFPIVNRLGVVSNEAVTVTIGATIFTDIAALLVLAICVSIHAGEFSVASLSVQLIALGLYSVGVLFGLDSVGRQYFRRTGDQESNQFLFILLAVFLASVGAELINVDKIIGAFLAGLAVNDLVGTGPVKEKIEFVGSTLFIPFFFVGMGLLLDIQAFIESLTNNFALTLGIVVALVGSKFLAAAIAKIIYRYSWNQAFTMWSLSIPQVAATLAAALVGFNVGLISESVFNSIIVLMLVTSILGPLMTTIFASRLPLPQIDIKTDKIISKQKYAEDGKVDPFTVLVPVNNRLTVIYLVEMAALLARHQSGFIIPLSIVQAHVHMDEIELDSAMRMNRRLLNRAVEISKEFQVEAQPDIRIDDDIAEGISRTAKEKNADLIVMGWSEIGGLRSRLFGNIINNVFGSCHCPVAVMRLLDEPTNIRVILVPLKHITPQTLQEITFSLMFADTNQGEVTFLHVCDPRTAEQQMNDFESQLSTIIYQSGFQVKTEIKTVRHDDASRVITQESKYVDLVILRSIRRRTAGGLAVSNITMEVIQNLTCSMLLFGSTNS
ncbi:cation:proton antiporter [Okeania sp.]|uniref:cation:proton antiporter n=1 Tax=Okeania sp. TaxID=3100323 RepID=UPI002B4B0C67|nr:cation:proton antiporter [Okeania sp.]MEB3342894.1 cation:proton antiporter [Okeania sp.]